MAIKINGTTVTTNRLNGLSISSETLNGTKVYGVVLVWALYDYDSSAPSGSLIVNEYGSSSLSPWPDLLDIMYPASNYPIGTVGSVYYSQIGMYAIFIVRSL